jgi:hypothetical protein
VTKKLYQAKAGDGANKSTLKRMNKFFKSPQDAIVEALYLKEKMDEKYNKEIQWDYDGKITGTKEKAKILKGYLRGNRKSNPFYLEVLSSEQSKDVTPVTPLKYKKDLSENDLQVMKSTKLLFK